MTISVPRRHGAASDDPEELLLVGYECARRAGSILLEHWSRPPRGVRAKSGPADLVSEADLAAEQSIRELLSVERPGDGVLGEEHEETPSSTGLRWVVDPLDGTANFLRRIPHWAVSVSCEDDDGPLAAVVHDPLRDDWFSATRGAGATANGRAVNGSKITDLKAAALGGEFSAHTAPQAECTRRLVGAVGQVRNFGACALDLAWAAEGRFDAAYHVRFPPPWDHSAGQLLCREAGLTFERVPDPDDTHDRLLAAPPALAQPLRELILG